jgi:molybdopterin synthase sulfur carrier subunit
VRYFAWLRERVGASEEEVETDAATVADLVADLRARDEAHALAFADLRAVRIAIDEELADLAAPLQDVREVAFFPPMTGG